MLSYIGYCKLFAMQIYCSECYSFTSHIHMVGITVTVVCGFSCLIVNSTVIFIDRNAYKVLFP